ncbi:MAG TPA: hypothetical protein VFQ84_12485 [Arenimonas sp.]|uniref:hypothetical protein n=1 Tax=Arenimonas sp. TaxID=1872635 RepID=UPI002D7F4DCE|nr:hypothetical protein [Arenimonas sp.]HEU0154150.1 hypothetical protein [Arenimonas sp.]
MKAAPALLFALALAAAAPMPEAVAQDAASVDELVTSSDAFLSAHPDLRFRLSGLRQYREGNFEKAFVLFKRAARYADKPSQGMVAEMLWKGEGVPMDRPAAYIWMDLAAERGYKQMLLRRETFWNDLSEAEREQALAIGDDLFLEYADKYAKPRAEQKMRLAKRQVTGSRTGFTGALTIVIPTPGGSRTIDGSTYYDEKYWEPRRYWQTQDQDWKGPPTGTVSIGELQSGDLSAPPSDDAEGEEDDSPR